MKKTFAIRFWYTGPPWLAVASLTKCNNVTACKNVNWNEKKKDWLTVLTAEYH